MANQMYGAYNPSCYGGTSGLSSVYASAGSIADRYLSADSSLLGSSRYRDLDPLFSSSNLSSYSSTSDRGPSMLFNHTDSAASRIPGSIGLSSWPAPPGVDVGASAAADPLFAGFKRPSSSEIALYHQTLLGAHNTFGQSDAWYSTNPLAKRPRFESASNLPIYPQRPGEKDCAHYMLTRTCKFGDSCKFDHPIWVPEGGIPDWKEVPINVTNESLPERPGESDCPYFLKTQRCKFGQRCKFNHPKDKVAPLGAPEIADGSALPDRPSEPPCVFYTKTGKCKFGATCKFHHPKDILIPQSAGLENTIGGHIEGAKHETAGNMELGKPNFTPALLHNSKGLPIRPGEVDCPFYLKTGSCKYGATCRYNHPDIFSVNQPASVPGFVTSPATRLNIGGVNPAASILQTMDPRLAQATLGLGQNIYPQRPGQMECDFYMKTGECKFVERCKYHHPIDRSTLSAKEPQLQSVKLTLAGLPRREGAVNCPYYMKTGTCKYGASCKFDHPPPGEVMATAATQGTASSIGGEGKEA